MMQYAVAAMRANISRARLPFFLLRERNSENQPALVRLRTATRSALMTECQICSRRFEH